MDNKSRKKKITYTKEIVGLTAQEVLLSVFDLALPFFQASRIYRVSANKYLSERSIDKSNFSNKIRYLKRRGLVETLVQNKEGYIEITPAGIDRITALQDLHPVIDRPESWDKKWRMVIFDVPEKHKGSRDVFRLKLIEMGFEKVQDSVYVYPFECSKVIMRQSQILLIEKYVLVSISEIIQGENAIIEQFLDKGVLKSSDLK